MRVSISHNKGQQQAIRLVNDQADQLFSSVATGPVQIVDTQKTWVNNVMNFAFKAKMGFFTVPITGVIECTEQEVIINIDLPEFITKMIPEDKIRANVEGKVRGMLGPGTPSRA